MESSALSEGLKILEDTSQAHILSQLPSKTEEEKEKLFKQVKNNTFIQ